MTGREDVSANSDYGERGGTTMRLRSNLIVVISFLMAGFLLAATGRAAAATAEATVNSISAAGVGTRLGTVTFSDTAGGLLIAPKLSGLPPGTHGFHIHEKGDCSCRMNQGKLAAGFSAVAAHQAVGRRGAQGALADF
jgi:Cu-Zn family superoxide dismutase